MTQAASSAVHNLTVFSRIVHTLKQVFPVVRPYVVNVPSFFTPWGFVLASRGKDPLQLAADALNRSLEALSGELAFYDYETHVGMFSLPKYIRTALGRVGSVITDSSPLSFY